MKQFLTFSAILAMALPAFAAGMTDTFDNGTFDLGEGGAGWNWISDGTFTAAIYDVSGTTDDELSLTAPFPPGPGATFVAGAVGATATYTNTVVWATINTNSPNPVNDQALLSRLNTTTLQGYALNYDPNGGDVEIVYIDMTDVDGDGEVTYDLGDFTVDPIDQTINIRLSVLTSGSVAYLVSQAWSEDWSTMLGEHQLTVDGSTMFDGYAVPVLPGGLAGLGALVNSNNVGPLDTRMDDWGTRPALPSDFNLDGSVDVSDLGILATNYGTTGGMTWSYGDANVDGNVDVSDLGILATAYGSTAVAASAVPEPATLVLLGLGALSLLVWRRK